MDVPPPPCCIIVQETFPASAIVQSAAVPPDQAVAMGAAIRAGMLKGVLPAVTVQHQPTAGWRHPLQAAARVPPSRIAFQCSVV